MSPSKEEVKKEAETVKQCPYCKAEIPISAVRCSHCGSRLPKPMKNQVLDIVLFFVFLVAFSIVFGIIGAASGGLSSNSSDLNANVSTNLEGITIVNNESSSWSGCEVGVNGGCGWDFQDPPYKTHKQYTIAGGQSLTVPYESMSSKDGIRFDITTHVVNSIVVMCSMGTNDAIDRSFCSAH